MKKPEKLQNYWNLFCLYWKRERLLPKLIALNLFSLVIFGIIENTIFRYFFGMTLEDSGKARALAFVFNSIVGIAWPMIEDYVRKSLQFHPWKCIRTKWEEFSLLAVKIIVNMCTYMLSGHYAVNTKLMLKVGIIVFISFSCADFLKYTFTPWVESLMSGDTSGELAFLSEEREQEDAKQEG